MSHRVNRVRRCFALVLPLAVALSGCGVADAGGPEPTPAELAGGSIASDFDLSGARFTVGSKEFTESIILSKITIYALRLPAPP